MPSTNDQITNLDAELDALESPTTAQVAAVTQDYDAGIVAASAAQRSINAGGAGGAAIVSCVLIVSSLNIVSEASHPLLWTDLQDDVWNTGSIGAIPDGLGLTFAFDGSSEQITAAESGTWAFTFFGSVGGALFAGDIQDGLLSSQMFVLAPGANTSFATLTVVYTLPEGAYMTPLIRTRTTPGGSNVANCSLVICRLG